MGELLKKSIKGVSWTSLSSIVSNVVSLIQIIILTRILDKSDFGLIALASVFLSFTSIFLDMGISVGILHRQNITKNEYSSLYLLNIITSILLCGIAMLFAPVYAKLNNSSEELTNVLRLLSISIIFSGISSQHRIVQQKEMRFKYLALIDISVSIVTMITAIILAKRGMGVYSLVFSSLTGSFLSSIIYTSLGLFKDKNIHLHFNLRDTFPFLKIGVYQLGATILDFFSREIDIIFIGSSFGNNTLGVYSLCKKIVTTIYNTVNPIFTKVLTPLFAKLQGGKYHLKNVYLKLVESLSMINFPIYFLISVFSFGILFNLYGKDYTEGAFVLSILSLYYGILTASNPVGSLQIALGRTDIGFYWTIYRILSTLLAVYIGSLFNINVMVVLFLILAILNTIIAWKVQIQKMIDISFKSYNKAIIRPLMFSLIIAVPYYIFFSKTVSIWLIIILSILFCIIYFVFVKTTMKDSYLINLLNMIIDSRFKKFKKEV